MINKYRDMDDVPTILDATALQAVMYIKGNHIQSIK